eukprot:TRINITY_DN13867_c0_g1_i1.p1 TRINITY_DN13867_c0_g1~~TRINITY_DN13867_c0_g1_i1.p1  ORF type:complete len:608 (+),score=142.98 TRINITY_DN13867_c0_g1_i1:777-2600(+)
MSRTLQGSAMDMGLALSSLDSQPNKPVKELSAKMKSYVEAVDMGMQEVPAPLPPLSPVPALPPSSLPNQSIGSDDDAVRIAQELFSRREKQRSQELADDRDGSMKYISEARKLWKEENHMEAEISMLEAQAIADEHNYQHRKQNWLNFFLSFLPSALLAAATAVVSAAMGEQIMTQDDKDILITVLGLSTGFFSSLSGYWNFQGKSEKHAAAAKGFQNIHMKFKELIDSLKYGQKTAGEFLTTLNQLNHQAMELSQDAPYIRKSEKIKHASAQRREQFADRQENRARDFLREADALYASITTEKEELRRTKEELEKLETAVKETQRNAEDTEKAYKSRVDALFKQRQEDQEEQKQGLLAKEKDLHDREGGLTLRENIIKSEQMEQTKKYQQLEIERGTMTAEMNACKEETRKVQDQYSTVQQELHLLQATKNLKDHEFTDERLKLKKEVQNLKQELLSEVQRLEEEGRRNTEVAQERERRLKEEANHKLFLEQGECRTYARHMASVSKDTESSLALLQSKFEDAERRCAAAEEKLVQSQKKVEEEMLRYQGSEEREMKMRMRLEIMENLKEQSHGNGAQTTLRRGHLPSTENDDIESSPGSMGLRGG